MSSATVMILTTLEDDVDNFDFNVLFFISIKVQESCITSLDPGNQLLLYIVDTSVYLDGHGEVGQRHILPHMSAYVS